MDLIFNFFPLLLRILWENMGNKGNYCKKIQEKYAWEYFLTLFRRANKSRKRLPGSMFWLFFDDVFTIFWLFCEIYISWQFFDFSIYLDYFMIFMIAYLFQGFLDNFLNFMISLRFLNYFKISWLFSYLSIDNTKNIKKLKRNKNVPRDLI